MKTLRAIAIFTDWRILAIGALLPAFGLAAEPAKKPPPFDPTTWNCELILGKHIRSLSLVDQYGQFAASRSRRASMFLPPGQYTIQQIDLDGGFFSTRQDFAHPEKPLKLAPGTPCRFDIRTPLTPSVTVKRAGRLLTLDYQLLDGDGRKYRRNGPAVTDSSLKPKFAVYQGDRLMDSGNFEYG